MFIHALHPTIERLAGAQTTWSGLRHELERKFLTRLLSFIPQRSMVEGGRMLPRSQAAIERRDDRERAAKH